MTETGRSQSPIEALIPYLEGRARQRTERVVAKWESLSSREQALVREAAVMGYVQGRRLHRQEFLGDAEVVHIVLDASDAFADLYPTLAALPTDDARSQP